MGPLSSVGSRWGWPFLAGIAALIGGSVGGWLPLERTGLALLGVVILCWLGTLLNLALVTAHGESAGATAVAGDRLIVRYTLRNRSPWPLAWAMLEPHGLSEVPVEGQFVALGPRQTRQIAVSLPCPRRGRWAAAGWTVHAGDPFGLFDRRRSRWDGETVIVYPRPVPLPALPSATATPLCDGSFEISIASNSSVLNKAALASRCGGTSTIGFGALIRLGDAARRGVALAFGLGAAGAGSSIRRTTVGGGLTA